MTRMTLFERRAADYFPNDVARVARSIKGSCDALAAELDALIRERSTEYTKAQQRERSRREGALQCWFATEFGRRHGYYLSRLFELSSLAKRDPIYGRLEVQRNMPGFADDHRYCYRDADRKLVFVAHPYLTAVDPAAIERWASSHQIAVSFPTDFPSWWWPGNTRLVVYRRAMPT